MGKILNAKKVILSFLVVILLSACYPDENFSSRDRDIVVTSPEVEVDYSAFKTYSMPDTVVKIVNGEGVIKEVSLDAVILSNVRSNMNSLGYVEETNPKVNEPDLILLITAQEDKLKQFNEYPLWAWWGWWANWFPGWGYGPNWSGVSPYLTGFVKYEAGTIHILMINPENNDASDKQVPIIWSAVINGLITGSENSIAERTTLNINTAFDQSPYLGTN
ncbi:MAG: DUF4136 domain-containing protein [Cyclobacteriaceae bacterium]